ncbi:unnamed protein product [Arctia plantaginis]|uniref:Uncharacterized protein n=1 Tax=Arctia plantaginis TaxID=874455 RepID=A0A8S1B0N1_ARCPL|nr:unnamed protein product [Arctia plantaginis]
MKLIIFTGLLAACTAASLEHLEKKQNSYLPAAKGSSSSPSKDSDVEGSVGDDTNAIGASSVDQPGLSAHSLVPSNPNLSSDKDLSSSATDSEFEGYFYGPGIQNADSQQSNLQARSQFGTQTPNQQFDQQGSSKYQAQHNRNQILSSQGPSQQFRHQAHNQQFAQQPHNEQFSQQTQSVSQQQQNQKLGQQPLSQQFGQQSQSQQYFQQTIGSHVGQQDTSPQSTNNFGAQAPYQPRSSFANNQNFGSQSPQNYPQQSFDEETGYHY